MLSVDWDKHHYLYQWPESARLKHALEENKRGICYTMPGIRTDELISTSVPLEIQNFFDATFSRIDIPLNEAGLRKLLKLGHLESALNATTVLLSLLGQGIGMISKPTQNTPTSLSIWGLRFQLLLALKYHQQLNEELVAFEELDAPDLFYEYGHSSQKYGTMVPFALRLVHAESCRYTPMPWKSITRLDSMKENVEMIIRKLKTENVSESWIEAWQLRLSSVLKTRARILFTLREYEQSMGIISTLKNTSHGPDKEQYCREMMRMALTVGDESSVNTYLSESATTQDNNLLNHKALRSMFLGAFSHSSDYVQRILKANDMRPNIINTAAISMLYTGNVKEGVKLLSKCQSPMPEMLLANLRALSELGLSTAQRETLMNEVLEKQRTNK